jgi:hypothetical protein
MDRDNQMGLLFIPLIMSAYFKHTKNNILLELFQLPKKKSTTKNPHHIKTM